MLQRIICINNNNVECREIQELQRDRRRNLRGERAGSDGALRYPAVAVYENACNRDWLCDARKPEPTRNAGSRQAGHWFWQWRMDWCLLGECSFPVTLTIVSS